MSLMVAFAFGVSFCNGATINCKQKLQLDLHTVVKPFYMHTEYASAAC